MTRSIYVMPISGSGIGHDYRQPAYKATLFPSIESPMLDYGDEPWCLVGIPNITPELDAAITANADVFKLPDDLDTTVGPAAATVRNRLEAVNVPGTWVGAGNTYRDVVRFIAAVCNFAQRFQGISSAPASRWFAGGRTLDSTFGQLSAGAQQALRDTADSFGFDRSALTGTTTLRAFLKSAGDQYVARVLAKDPRFTLNLAGPL